MKQVLACFAVMTALGCSAASPSTTILQPPSSVVAATPSATPGTTASAPSPDASMTSTNPFADETQPEVASERFLPASRMRSSCSSNHTEWYESTRGEATYRWSVPASDSARSSLER
jgi:hypothetical protein